MHLGSEVGTSHELSNEDVLPTGDGVLIIDEVKVQCTIILWRYRHYSCIGQSGVIVASN